MPLHASIRKGRMHVARIKVDRCSPLKLKVARDLLRCDLLLSLLFSFVKFEVSSNCKGGQKANGAKIFVDLCRIPFFQDLELFA